MTADLCVLYLGDDDLGVASDALASFEITFAPTAAELDAALDLESTDCVVIAPAPDDELAELVRSVRSTAPDIPCIALTRSPADGAGAVEAGATDTSPPDVPVLLARRVKNAVMRMRRVAQEHEGTEARIRALHDVATRLEVCETEEEIFDVAVDAAENILEFDSCYFGVVANGKIYPQAANDDPLLSDPVIMTVEEGVAGRTVRDGRTYVVDDAQEDPHAEPVEDSYRAALSIPVGDGGIFQAVSREYAAFDETDEELGELLAAHVAAALERVRYEEQLVTERDRFRALFEHIPDATVRYRFDGKVPVFDAVNQSFESLFGYTQDQVKGRSIAELLVPPDEYEAVREHIGALRRGEFLDKEVDRLTADGLRTFLMRTAPVDRGDDATGYLIYTDINDLKRRERELEHQNERLQQFASVVSHDLRNPLNVALGRMQVAREHNEMAVDDIDEAIDSMYRMNELIDDLLSLAKQGQLVADPEPVDLEAVARDAFRSVSTGNATLELESDLPTVPADRGRVQQLFENLFRNAVEHSSTSPPSQARGDAVEHSFTSNQNASRSDNAEEHASSGPDSRAPGADGEAGGDGVTITVGELESGYGFYVADDGPGIPATDREHVFETGFTTGDDGTGLGLSIVQQIAEAHGWRPRAVSSEFNGARIEFAFEHPVGDD